ncbi:hypothetical protein NP233_g12766 [Leucocoprinus birnbaumii]|uniref:Uncharacterized protein n=1 Tax=Leucocoprinus birnbaumii TaxID=56174 RepID=A0AAD5YJ70_9AGAR|nr:hypothetical protein NP233_g12766 [Leucocoprinus birnbaumii]
MVTFQELEARLAQLQNHQARPSVSDYQPKPPVVALALNPQIPFLESASRSSVVVGDTDGDIDHSSALSQPDPSPPSDSATTKVDWAMSGLLRAKEKTDIVLYATYCRVLALYHFSRYQTKRDILDLKEAAEYSVTTYLLLTDTVPVVLDLILPQTMTVLRAYQLKIHDMFPSLASINVLEASEELIRRSPETIDPPPSICTIPLGETFFKVFLRQKILCMQKWRLHSMKRF